MNNIKKFLVSFMTVLSIIAGVVYGTMIQTSVTTQAASIRYKTLAVGESAKLTISSKLKTNWSSNNNYVASVTSTGKVRARAEGTAIIKAKTKTNTYQFYIIVDQPQLSSTYLTLQEEGEDTLDVSNTNRTFFFESRNPDIAEVDEDGTIIANSEGETTIIACNGKTELLCTVVVIDRTGGFTQGPKIIDPPHPSHDNSIDNTINCWDDDYDPTIYDPD